MTVKNANTKIKDLEEFKGKIIHVFEVAQATTEEDYSSIRGRILSMINNEIIKLENLEVIEESYNSMDSEKRC